MTALSGDRVVLHDPLLHCPLQVLDMRNPTGLHLTLPFHVEIEFLEGVSAVAELRGNRLAAVSGDFTSVFDLGTGSELQSLPAVRAAVPRHFGRRFGSHCVAYSGAHLLVGDSPSADTALFVFAEEPDGKVSREPACITLLSSNWQCL